MRAHAAPLVVSALGTSEQKAQRLAKIPLVSGSGGGGYDESWLQALIHDHPAVLPIQEIEPGLVDAVSVCRELTTPSGFADNLLITPSGGIVLVEAKLWRNPQARREVVGQILDYAKDLSRWSYEDLERAVDVALGRKGWRLFDLVAGPEATADDEVGFVDAVSRNLRLGRFLCIIVGDGIQEGAEQLADFLQRHVGLHFTLSLVELALWRVPDQPDVLVLPRVIARTVQIERAVIRMDAGVVAVPAKAPPKDSSGPGFPRPTSISEEQFYERLAKVDPTLPDALRAFLTRVEPMGVYPDLKKHVSLKWRAPDGAEYHLGVIDPDGPIVTDYCHWSSDGIGRVDLSHAYQEDLAHLIPGATIKKTPKATGWRLVVGPRNPSVRQLLDHSDGWEAAIRTYIKALTQALGE